MLVEFFKALVEPARLRLAGLLVEAPLTVSEAQQRTGLPVRTVQNHLRALAHAGLAVVEGTGAAARYRIDENELRRLASTLLVSPRVQAMGDAGDERAKVLASFFRNGKLQHIPTGDRRRLIVLEEFAKLFEPGRVYTEPEVNEVIKQVYDRDYTTIRRWLVDLVFLNRHEGRYWVGEGRRAES